MIGDLDKLKWCLRKFRGELIFQRSTIMVLGLNGWNMSFLNFKEHQGLPLKRSKPRWSCTFFKPLYYHIYKFKLTWSSSQQLHCPQRKVKTGSTHWPLPSGSSHHQKLASRRNWMLWYLSGFWIPASTDPIFRQCSGFRIVCLTSDGFELTRWCLSCSSVYANPMSFMIHSWQLFMSLVFVRRMFSIRASSLMV